MANGAEPGKLDAIFAGQVNHLLGDFTFALWDGRRRRLFCAVDHLGFKPLYYARPGGGLFGVVALSLASWLFSRKDF